MKQLFVVITSLWLMSSVGAQELQEEQEKREIEEIIVTGSFIKQTQQEDIASPIKIVEREDISAAAVFNIAELALNLSANNGAQNQSDGFNQSFSIGTTNINLRGLGVSSSLTLLNGRRQTMGAATTLNGDQFVDLNALIPTIAIERIEVLQDGTSSLYGADAVAGVVNFKTRKTFEGLELDATYATTSSDSQKDVQISAIYGRSFGGVHAVFAASFFDRSSLSAADRRDEFQLRDAFSIFGQPGTYLVFPPPPTRTLDPLCEGTANNNDDVSVIKAGPLNPTCRFDFGDFFSLVAKEERLQGYADLTADINDLTEWFLEFGYTKNKVVSTSSPSQPVLFPPSIPDNNPAAIDLGIPSGGRALAFHRVNGAGAPPSRVSFDYDTYRVATGLRGEFSDNWSYEAAITNSQNNFDYFNPSDTLIDRYKAALAGNGGANNNAFYNPLFGATGNNPAVREDFRGIYLWAAQSSLLTIDAFLSGVIGQLPAGAIGLAVGAQYRKDKLSYDYNQAAEDDNLYFFIGNRDFSGDQEAYAGFAEVKVPFAKSLEVQAAIRYEDFSGDNSIDPKIGFLWQPLKAVSVRGTFGTSFRIPSIFQKAGRFNVPARVRDANRGDALVTVAQQTSPDPQKPVESQESETLNIGASWVSNNGSWRASIDYWNFDYKNFITPENPTAVVKSAPDGPQVTRSSNGTLLAVRTFFRNAGSLKTDGIDFSIGKDIDVNATGVLTLNLNLTRVFSYDLQDPVAGQLDGLGQRNFTNFGVPMPELRGNLRASWTAAHHNLNAYVRYTNSYKDENNENAPIDSFVSVDLRYSFDTSAWFGRDKSPVISMGAKNIFDAMPPDVVSRTGYDALTHNPLGRQIYISVQAAF